VPTASSGGPPSWGTKPVERCGACLHSETAPEHDRVVARATQRFGEDLDVAGPLGEHEAVPARLESGVHVGDHLAAGPSKSAATEWQRLLALSGCEPTSSSPLRWAATILLVKCRYWGLDAPLPFRQPPGTAGTHPARPVLAFVQRVA
jgi:hypothetical protein